MKGMRGKFLGKLTSISTITSMKQTLVFHSNPFNQYFQTPTLFTEVKHEENHQSPMGLKIMDSETDNHSLLIEFEEKCPPGGGNSVILYTTSLRGIRKTFENCKTIKFLLESVRVLYEERDVSMHLEFREELWRTLGGRVIPPSLFIKGRYVGGVDEVVELHEQGKLVDLLNGIPKSLTSGPCEGCGGVRFLLCFSCNGSRKVIDTNIDADTDTIFLISCEKCNENGLVKCPVCF